MNGVKYAVSYWTERGGRPYQEDRHQVIKGTGAEDSSLYGVFDGHGKFFSYTIRRARLTSILMI